MCRENWTRASNSGTAARTTWTSVVPGYKQNFCSNCVLYDIRPCDVWFRAIPHDVNNSDNGSAKTSTVPLATLRATNY